jgi:hypothetical protein
MYSSTLSLNSVLVEVGGQRHAPAALPRGKKPGTLLQEAGWAAEPVWTCAENVAPTGIRPLDRNSFATVTFYRK